MIVVGGGPAGLEAALAAQNAGAEHILVVDREFEAGGILLQCIHSGFGLHRFDAELTGPEYAQRLLNQIVTTPVDVLTDAYVADIAGNRRSPSAGLRIKLLSAEHGLHVLEARSIVLAMGARERTRGAIRIPGTRPSGVLTAGLAQKYVNMMGYLPGRRAVILGSGDIGLIMARRLTLEGVEVAGVFEIMPHPNGLGRNIVQCLEDFDIPLHLSTTVVEIHADRLEKSRWRRLMRSCARACRSLGCRVRYAAAIHRPDPDNELAHRMRLRLDPVTSGPVVSSTMETSVDGIFACGNGVHIHDLVDFVSRRRRWRAATPVSMSPAACPGGQRAPVARRNVSTIACAHHLHRPHMWCTCVCAALEKCTIRLSTPAANISTRKLRYVVPAEMVNLTVRPRFLENFHGGALG